MLSKLNLSLALLLGSLALAHPGEEHHEDHHASVAKRALFDTAKRSYSACSKTHAKRELNDRVAEKRNAEIASLRSSIAAVKRQQAKRQDTASASGMPSGTAPSGSMPSGAGGPTESGGVGGSGSGGGGGSATFDSTGETLLNTSHASSLTGLTVNSTASQLFGEDTTCLLQPEATIGPYWVAGEYIRYDVSESQPGIPLYLSTQVIDVGSCSPLSDIYWEIWHANASGVYSGVIASGNGDDTDSSNIDNTFLRGLQPSDSDGLVAQKTVFPGHYTGRTTHLHVIAHSNVTTYPNGTIGTGSSGDSGIALHIGQLFFDQDLLTAVSAVSPYSENTQTTTTNAEDSILAGEAVDGASDPFFEYVYLGDDISDGIYAWATVGITTNTTYTTQAASYLTEEGGEENTESSLGGEGGMGGSASMMGSGTVAVDDTAATASAASSSSSSSVNTVSSVAASASSNAGSRVLPTIAARVGGLIRAVLP